METAQYWPMLAMIGWTMGLGTYAVFRRTNEIRTKGLSLRRLAKSRDVSSALDDTQVMNNFNNLLQVPLLFLCLVFSIDYASIAQMVGSYMRMVICRA